MSLKDKTDIEKLRDALNEMILDPTCKINKNAVAKRAGVNHAVLYKKYDAAINIKRDVEKAEEIRAAELKSISLEAENAKLRKRNKSLETVKETVKSGKSDDGKWMAYLTEMYSMNDQMKETNSDLSNQLTHGQGTEVMYVDKESGEIVEGVFDKKHT